VAQCPARSHAVAATVGHGFARPHGLHGAPQTAPTQSASEQLKLPCGTHAPDGSQAFTSMVSKQLESPGAHRVQPEPHAFPAQGSYGW
jgi:hypothetical protein